MCFLIFNFHRQNQVNNLINNHVCSGFEVVEKQCRSSRGGSHVVVRHKGNNYRIEYYEQKCFDAEIGGKLMLYYDSKNDFFYVPGSPVYERYIYGCIVLMLLSFVPWNYLNKRLKGIEPSQ